MTKTELQHKVESVVKEIFPNSYLHVSTSTLGGPKRPSLGFNFAIGKDKTVWKNGIIYNDNGHTIFLIHLNLEGDEIKSVTLDSNVHGLRDKLTFKTDKLGWRNTNKPGAVEPIIKAIKKYFANMKEKLDKK